MKEVTFIRRNIEKWKETEKVVERAASLSPDQLADAYTDLTADLAFAQTHFPTSRITIYLNNLASALHNEIYRNKREKWTRIITWVKLLPNNVFNQSVLPVGITSCRWGSSNEFHLPASVGHIYCVLFPA